MALGLLVSGPVTTQELPALPVAGKLCIRQDDAVQGAEAQTCDPEQLLSVDDFVEEFDMLMNFGVDGRVSRG